MTVQILRKKFTVGQYHQMIESEILTDRDRVELLQGEIVEMSPVGFKHAACVDRLNDLLARGLGDRAIVRVQSPIQLSNDSEPQPDIAILRRRDDFYGQGHPQPPDIFTLIEVSDTTVKYDREKKLPLYAQDGIPEVWIVDLTTQIVERYTAPSQSGYQQTQTLTRQQSINLQAFPDIILSIVQILG
ncbi:MAG: Uma2 family endonuclease [Spirulina sp. SIO3F2]|nr:Uma2 family endonuclease [Spirulina sp. SIO3F2]